MADVKMEIPVLVRSLKSSILSSTSFQMGKTFWGVVGLLRETGNSSPEADTRIPPNQKKMADGGTFLRLRSTV